MCHSGKFAEYLRDPYSFAGVCLGCPSVRPDHIILNLREDSNSRQMGINLMSPPSFYEVEINKFIWGLTRIP